MEITTLQVIGVGLVAGFCMFGWLFGIYFSVPLVYAFFVGLILNDVKTGLVVGSTAQILWLGFGFGTGGVRPPDPIAPGVLGTVIGVVQHHGKSGLMSIQEASVIVGLTFAFGIMVQFLITFALSAMSPVSVWAKNAAKNGKYKLFIFYSWTTAILVGIIGFALGVASAEGGKPLAIAMKSFPTWMKTSLKVVGGLLPALGFALIMSVMLKKEYIAYIFVGYFLFLVVMVISKQLNTRYSLMLLAVAALGIALIVVGIESRLMKSQMKKTLSKREVNNEGI